MKGTRFVCGLLGFMLGGISSWAQTGQFSPENWPATINASKKVHYVVTDGGLTAPGATWLAAELQILSGDDQVTEDITIGGHTGKKVTGNYLNIADPSFGEWADDEIIDILVQAYGDAALFNPQGQPRNFNFLTGTLPELAAPVGGQVPVEAKNKQWNWILFRIPNGIRSSDGSHFVGSIPANAQGGFQKGGVNGGTIRFEAVPNLIVRVVAFGEQGAFGEPEAPAQDAGANVALRGTAYSNRPLLVGNVATLINGDTTDLVHGDFAIAPGFAYWVDLGKAHAIKQLKIYPRQDGCCPERLRAFRVSIHAGDVGPLGMETEVWGRDLFTDGSNAGSGPGTVVQVTLPALQFGRWVQIKALLDPVPDYFLQISELEVFDAGLAVVSVQTRGNVNGVTVTFSDSVSEASATDPSHYSINNGVTVNSVTMIETTKVRLNTSPLVEGQVYTLTVNGVQDRRDPPLTITPDSQITFLQTQGVITRRQFDDIAGTLVSDLTSSMKFPASPDTVTLLTRLEAPTNVRDNYGQQIQGFLTAPATGEYTFYLSSDDQSVLYLSSDEEPAHKQLIASDPQGNPARAWITGANQASRGIPPANVSAPVHLDAGRKYYLEALMKEGTGGDNLAITWRKPGDPEPRNGDQPIPGDFLSTLNPVEPATLVTQPASQTVDEYASVNFSVQVSGTPPYDYQWFKNGLAILGANGPGVRLQNVSATDSGTVFAVLAGNGIASIRSPDAILTVNPDLTPPTLVSAEGSQTFDQIVVHFSERIRQADATNTASYSVNNGISILSAALQADGQTVILTTSPQTPGVMYTLTVNGIHDLASLPNVIAADTQTDFITFALLLFAESPGIVEMLVTNERASATLFNDTQATEGTVARVATVVVGECCHGEWGYYREAPAAGRYRVTMRARIASGRGTAIRVTAGAETFSPYFYHANSVLDFSDMVPASGFVERFADLLLPATTGNWYLGVLLTEGMDVDWIKMEVLPAGLYPAVEVVQAQTEKLFYKTGTNAQVKVRLLNTSATAQTLRLQVRLESGLADSQTVYDTNVTVPATGKPELFTLPVGVLPAGGTAVVVETLDADGQVLSTARDYSLSGDSPVDVSPIFGVFGGIAEPVYSADDALFAFREQRLRYAAFAELDFWAPCDTTMLTSPPGRTNWWSGQTLKRISIGQLQGYKEAADAQGISLVAYVDYSVNYGWRILEAARKQPEILEWDVSNESGPHFVFAMGPNGAAPLDSRQRREDEAQWSYTGADGAAKVILSSPAMLKLHGDQLVATMNQLGWLGFRYDDPLAYDSEQIDIFGRLAPFGGWSNESIIHYFRDRITAQNPDAVYGRNADGMRAGYGGYSDAGGKTTQSATEAAILRGGGGFLLQEAFSNLIFRGQRAYTDIRDHFVTGGRNAKAGEGHIFAITDMSAAANDGEREYVAALAGAAGVQLAYQPSTMPYMQFLARYCGLLFGKRVHPVETPASLVSVDAGRYDLWWSNNVYCHYLGAGHRQYVVHLLNPPAASTVGDTVNSPEPPALSNVLVSFTLPAGWTATKATLLTPDNRATVRSFIEKVPDKYSIPNEITEAFTKMPTSEALALIGSSVTVPQISKWIIVVLDCAGPVSDLPDGPASTLPPLPTVPDVNLPPSAPLATGETLFYLQDKHTWPNQSASVIIADANARGGTALLITSNMADNESTYLGVTREKMGRAGTYKFTVRIRTETDTANELQLRVLNDSGEPKPYSVSCQLSTATLTTADGYREFSCTLPLGEAVHRDLAVGLQNLWPGLVIDDLHIELLEPTTDAERLPLRGETAWPGNTNVPDFTWHQVPRVWFGNGLYHEYFRIKEALQDAAPAAQIHLADPYLYGSNNRGWHGRPFPGTPAALMEKNLIVLADVPSNNNRWPLSGSSGLAWLDWLRGYVEKGGRVLLTGGPYGFGRGAWNSDLIAPMLPVTLVPWAITGLAYDLQPVSGGAVPLQPTGPLADGLDWSTSALVMWLHQATARPEATVQATAEGQPAIVTGTYGAGRVAVVLLAPLGEPPAGQTAFWDAPQWRPLMSNVLGWLLAPDPSAGPVISPDAGTYARPLTVTLDSLRAGASVRYTTDGSTPTETEGTLYMGPFTLTESATVKAVSFGSGLTTSGISSAALTVVVPSRGVFSLHTTQVPSTPNASENRPYELGTKFQSLQPGRIAKIRYYKAPSETGPHTGRVWSVTGNLLASVEFANETASGWQEQPLSEPLTIAANTTYVVSVNANVAYAYTDEGLAAPLTNGPVIMLADDANGVFGDPGVFPTRSNRNRDYFRDVVFVTEGTGAPQITALPDQFVDELTTLRITIPVTDPDLPFDTLTFNLGPETPAGASLDPATGVFIWTPTEAQGPATYEITVQVTDGSSPPLSDSRSFSVTVREVNTPPLLQLGGLVTGFQDDFEAPELNRDWKSIGPVGSDYSVVSGVLSIKGTQNYPSHLLYSAPGYDDDAQEILARMRINSLLKNNDGFPGLAVCVRADSQGINYFFRDGGALERHTGFLDDNRSFGPALDYEWENHLWYWIRLRQEPNAEPGAPDAFAKVWRADGTEKEPAEWESWDYYPAQPARRGLAGFSAGAFGADLEFEVDYVLIQAAGLPLVQVAPQNPAGLELPPLGDLIFTEGSSVTLRASAYDDDLPGQKLRFSLGPDAPAGAGVDAATGVLTWTPSEEQGGGRYPISIIVTDDGSPPLSDSKTVTITVNEVNSPPVLTVADQVADEEVEFVYQPRAEDPDVPTNALAFELASGPSGAKLDPTTGQIRWTPAEADGPGAFPFTIKVTDNGVPSLSDTKSFNVLVREVNQAPLLAAVEDQVVDEGQELRVGLAASDDDLPAQTLRFSLEGDMPAGAVVDPASGVFSWTPTEEQGPGSYTITVAVTDDGSPALSATRTFTVVVNEVNRPPELSVASSQLAEELSELTFAAAASDPNDSPPNRVTLSASGLPEGASFDPATGRFSWTPSEAQGPGSYVVTFTAMDDGVPPLTASNTISITVSEMNAAPVLAAIGDKSVDELSEPTFAATASDPNDSPPNAVTLSASGLPDGASFDPATGRFSWTPTEAQGPGSYIVTFTATDDGIPPLSASESITITVKEVNAAPALAAIGNKSVDELSELTFAATASDSNDSPPNRVTLSASGLPIGASFDPASGVFLWRPSEAQGPGSYVVTFTATDDGSPPLSANETITITVNEVNSAPVLAAIGNQRVSANETLTFTVSGSDPNDVPPNELVFTATDLPPGAVFDPLARLFSWQPGTDQVGDHTVTFRATDDGTPPLSASETITITVAAPPAPVQLVGVDVSGGLFKFAWRTEAGRRYRIQTKNNLSDPEWTDGPEVTGEGEFSEPISLDGQRYYRVKAE